MGAKQKRQSKRGSGAPSPSARGRGGRGRGGRGGRSGRGRGGRGGRGGRQGRGDWTALDFVPLESQLLPSRSPANKKAHKTQKMTGKRVLHEERVPLRFQPVEFVRADVDYDPADIVAKMIKEPLQGEMDPEVDLLEQEELENEVRASDAAADTETETEAETEETGYVPDGVSDDGSENLWGMSEVVPETEHLIDDLQLDSMNLDSESDSDSGFGDDLDAAADMSSNQEWSRSSGGSESDDSESDGSEISDNDEDSDSDEEFGEADVEALTRFAMRDIDSHYSDFFDDPDSMESDEADDLIQHLIEGSVDFKRYATPHQSSRGTPPVSKRRKERRKARELERLTNFGRDPELWVRFPEQITVHEVLEELQAFVATEDLQEIRFPPLDHNANWYVKELAKLHGAATFMQGRGALKCVVVARTARTGPLHNFSKLRMLMAQRQVFTRVDLGMERAAKRPKETRSSARVRDGDIVGRHAETIQSDNIGHQLMRMMGWTEGTGLGAAREGITVPIAATMKLSKRGIAERVD